MFVGRKTDRILNILRANFRPKKLIARHYRALTDACASWTEVHWTSLTDALRRCGDTFGAEIDSSRGVQWGAIQNDNCKPCDGERFRMTDCEQCALCVWCRKHTKACRNGCFWQNSGAGRGFWAFFVQFWGFSTDFWKCELRWCVMRAYSGGWADEKPCLATVKFEIWRRILHLKTLPCDIFFAKNPAERGCFLFLKIFLKKIK